MPASAPAPVHSRVWNQDERDQYDRGYKTRTCICSDEARIEWRGHAPHCVRVQDPVPDLRPDWLVEEEDGD